MSLLLQWNLDGYFKRLAELQQLIAHYNPIIIALQETHLRPSLKHKPSKYNIIRHDHFNPNSHACGGTCLLISDGYKYHPIPTPNSLQNIAVSVSIPQLHPLPITFCSVYIPPSHNTSSDDISTLIQSLPSPYIICGDLNAHSPTWGIISNEHFRSNSRGNIIDYLLSSDNNLSLLNHPGTPTHLNSTYGSLSAIDLTLSSTDLSPKVRWATHLDLCDSDHFPIILSSHLLAPDVTTSPPRWLINKANWPLFHNLTEDTSSLPDPPNSSSALEAFTNFVIKAAESSIPRSSGINKPRQVPWWSDEISSCIKSRRKAYRSYQSSHSQTDFINYKKARANARAQVRSAKKRSWSSFIEGINHPVSPSAMWRGVKRISGNGSYHHISQLKSQDFYISDPSLITEALANHFSSVSSNTNYDDSFLFHKLQTESSPVSFDSPAGESPSYNLPISEYELISTIHKNLKNAAPGQDNIHASMLKNLHPTALSYLLSLFNSIFLSNNYPLPWKTVIILPILKPSSDPHLPGSYRPIALSSVLGKLFQKILNKRLLWYLESNNLLSPFQYGFRKGRNSSQALIDLQNEIKEATSANSCLYSVFFDLQEAFPRVWRHYIENKLSEIGLRGNLPSILQSFLHNRSLLVRIQNITSAPHTVENGVPQGEVLSVLLFLLAINDITKCVKPPLTQRLFADDYSISVRSSNPTRAHRLLQESLDAITKWTSTKGFRFSSSKTYSVIFKKRIPVPCIQPLILQDFQIPSRTTAKLLGLLFDQRLNWSTHIKTLKAKCLQSLNILKYLSHPSKGCNRKLLTQLYRSLIRSRLDYGAPVYGLASKSVLALLDTVQSSSLRMVLGAFRTSPKLSLCAEAAEPPLFYRRMILTSNLLASVAQYPHLPIYNPIFLPFTNQLSSSCNLIRTHLEIYLDIPFNPNPLPPIFLLAPPWTLTPPSIRLDLIHHSSTPSNLTYRQLINDLIHEYPLHSLCLTDGSKTKSGTAYAYSIDGALTAYRIPNIASIFTAELMAIFACLSELTQLPPNSQFLLLTDSLSSLHSLTDPYSSNPLVQRIQLTLLTLSSINSHVTFGWIPGHIDFPKHDAVDRAAKQATSLPHITDNTCLPVSDLKNHYRSLILQKWQTLWENQPSNKLLRIKKYPSPWKSSLRPSRKEEVILSRLRIGHTRITHSYLLNPYAQSPPPCPHCREENLTVDHFFTCSHLRALRKSINVPSSIIQALKNNSDSISLSLQYLRSTEFFSAI